MGVVIENDDFDIFDLLKDLETMRHNLYNKQKQNNQDSQTHLVESAEGDNTILLVEWVQEESSEAEDFILVESRKKIYKIGKRSRYHLLASILGRYKKILINPRVKVEE
jgi:hypothetical protein